MDLILDSLHLIDTPQVLTNLVRFGLRSGSYNVQDGAEKIRTGQCLADHLVPDGKVAILSVDQPSAIASQTTSPRALNGDLTAGAIVADQTPSLTVLRTMLHSYLHMSHRLPMHHRRHHSNTPNLPILHRLDKMQPAPYQILILQLPSFARFRDSADCDDEGIYRFGVYLAGRGYDVIPADGAPVEDADYCGEVDVFRGRGAGGS